MKLSKNHNKHVLTLTEAELDVIRYALHNTSCVGGPSNPALAEMVKRASAKLKAQTGHWEHNTFRNHMDAVGSGK